MPQFNVGDAVRVKDHRNCKYIGQTGRISEVDPNTPAPNTSAITPSGGSPPLGRKTTYNVTIDEHPYLLTRLEEEWLELLSDEDTSHQQDEGSHE